MSDQFLRIRELPVTFAADTGTVAEGASCSNFKQRKRIKLNSESSSPSSKTLTVDEGREEKARERCVISSVDVGETELKKNVGPLVLISAKRCAVAPSQGPLLYSYNYERLDRCFFASLAWNKRYYTV